MNKNNFLFKFYNDDKFKAEVFEKYNAKLKSTQRENIDEHKQMLNMLYLSMLINDIMDTILPHKNTPVLKSIYLKEKSNENSTIL